MVSSDVEEMDDRIDMNTQQANRDIAALGEAHPDAARKARIGYRKELTKATDAYMNKDSVTLDEIAASMKRTNNMHDKTGATGDTTVLTLDSKIMGFNGVTAAHIARRTRNESSSFDIDDLFRPLRNILGIDKSDAADIDMADDGSQADARVNGRLGDWEKFGWMAAKRCRRVMGVEFMHGPLAIEHKKRVIKRRAAQRNGRQQSDVQPENIVDNVPQNKEHETNAMVQELDDLLVEATTACENNNTKLNLFEWFINPKSYGQSVENLFYTSFLLRDGKCMVLPGEDGDESQFYIGAAEPPDAEDEDAPEGGWQKQQVVAEFSEQVWRDAIEAYGIKKSIIPHRPEANADGP